MNQSMIRVLNSTHLHTIACWLMIGIAITPMFSPPLVSVLEVLLILIILVSEPLRMRVIRVWQQPLAKAAWILYAIITVGVFYSAASMHTATVAWISWRKLLMLPLALALFDDPAWKQRLLIIFVSLVTILAVISFVTWYIHYPLSVKFNGVPGILLRNYVIQGMMFSTGAFGAAMLALYARTLTMQIIFVTSVVILTVNSVLVVTGRSGYLALLVFALVVVVHYLYIKHWTLPKIAMGSVITLAIMTAILFISPTSRGRITLGINEAINYKHQEPTGTSIGLRILFWNNAGVLIGNRPVFGYGTGGFGTAYSQLVAGRPGAEGISIHEPHNQYLKMAVEHGLIGLIAFLAMLIAAIVRQHPTGTQLHRILGLGTMAAWAATSLANSHFSYFTEGTFIHVWLGVMLAGGMVLSTAATTEKSVP